MIKTHYTNICKIFRTGELKEFVWQNDFQDYSEAQSKNNFKNDSEYKKLEQKMTSTIFSIISAPALI